MKLAVSGKGGVGKTTLAAGLAFLFARQGRKVYAVDADPDSNLGWALGFTETELNGLIPLADMKEDIEKLIGRGPFFAINPPVEELLSRSSLVKDGLHYLRMGGIKQGGSACYCPENALLRAVLQNLLFERKEDAVILDMAAGIEHLTRGTARGVDAIIIVLEPNQTSMSTARTIIKLANDLGIKNVGVIGNKVRTPEERGIMTESFSDHFKGCLSYNEDILKMGIQERAKYPTSFLDELERLIEDWHLKQIRQR